MGGFRWILLQGYRGVFIDRAGMPSFFAHQPGDSPAVHTMPLV